MCSKRYSPTTIDFHQYIIDKEKNNKDSENLSDVSRMLVKFSILEGELNKFIIDATDPEGPDGKY